MFVNAWVEARRCVMRVRNVGDSALRVVRVEMAATKLKEMRVLLPAPSLVQRVLGRQPSLIVRGASLGEVGSAGGVWAAASVR